MSFGARYIPQDPRQRQAERNARNAAVAEQVRRAQKPSISMGGCTSAAPLPKGETARPGKRAPTKQEREWMDSLVAYGCVACRMDGNGIVAPQIHHILRGGRRMGHLFTLPLCRDHHQDTGRPGYTARHPWKTRFEKLYGTEMELLDRLRAELAKKKEQQT